MKMKIGVLSDTHLYKVTRELEEIYEQYLSDMDFILHAGDFVSVEVVEFLNRGNFHGVHGNMDPDDIRRILPERKVIRFGPYRLALVHGWGSSEGLEERIWPEFKDADIIVYGHSHRAANHTRKGTLFFNPGRAIGYNLSGNKTLGILELDDGIKGKTVNIPGG
ncbi:metallophosphoesterase family protein [Thermodesulfobacteriota bacterium]